MKARDYLQFSGIELANENRTAAYLAAGYFTTPSVVSSDCGCSATDDGPYNGPDVDNPPWLDANRLESEQFLGLVAHEIRIDSVIGRAVTPKWIGGATIGKMRPRHRIVSVTGLMLGQTEQSMSYAERWLTDVLAGIIVGCAPDTLRILLACPEPGYSAQFRTLRRVGIVDGPNFGPIGELPECYIQEVQFQIAAGIPYLLGDEVVCMAETALVGGS